MDIIEYLFPVSSTAHTLAAVIWVGGMFFAHMVLRPSLLAEAPPLRLAIWSRVFSRFFAWVWAAAIVLPATGYAMVFVDFGGFAAAGRHVTVMHIIGWIMVTLFAFLFFQPYAAFQRAVGRKDWPEAGMRLIAIRRIVTTNLILGLFVVGAGVSGRFWG
ncbi:MAG: CopD family protein [Alphaproteobacteria bacterium]|nr:CopD family protein [Alphaproteobacteria bacterium]MBF0251454.1 CopD family protein [Alphaproteobacteria bacterium]